MTAATPMIMPSIVRPVRILLRPSALKAMRNVMSGDMASPERETLSGLATAAATAGCRCRAAAAEPPR